MSQLLSRRGFTQLLLAAGAGLAVPSAGAAQLARLTGRLSPAPDPTRLIVDLYVRHSLEHAITIAGTAIHLDAELATAAGDYELFLRKEVVERRWISRAAPPRREEPRVIVPPGREQLYGRFVAPWPRELAPGTDGAPRGEGTLSVHAALDVDPASRPEAERETLAMLGNFRGATQVILPA